MPDVLTGYRRADGAIGFRNLVAVISLLDLANDVAIRIARPMPQAVAVLTLAGGLALPPETRRLDTLRRRLCRHPNVGAVIAIGPTQAALDDIEGEAVTAARPAATICLLDQADSIEAVRHGARTARRFRQMLAEESRVGVEWSALRIGLRSSSSSALSARTVNPVVGGFVDQVTAAGGSVCFTELADLAGVAETLAARGATPAIAAAIRRAMATPVRLCGTAPDPTPTNRAGGIDTLAAKGEGALRRLGSAPIRGVFRFGTAIPGSGLHLMTGPGSAALSLAGLTAAGCNLIVHTVGMTSIAAAAPFAPILKLGPTRVGPSRDLDLAVADPPGGAVEKLMALARATANGTPTAAELLQARELMLPGVLPPL